MNAKHVFLLQLFWSFLRMSPTAFGGGYAMLPIIEREIVERRQWMDKETLGDLLSLAAAAPGGVGINAAAAVGFRVAGGLGAIAAVLGMTMPAFALVLGLGFGYEAISAQAKAIAALQGIKGGVVALIAFAAWRMAKAAIFDTATLTILAATLACLILTPLHPGWLIGGGLCIGSIIIAGKGWLGIERRLEKPRKPQEPDELYPEYYI
ncbi:chromate transporter [Paenibacillus sp. 1P07SE]|uniref:chromate transporter n=1 Tax=Paenibacillus sp. 1P07SE TaxID=3132209 RepID=UPI0039A63867